ncbi:MAG: ribulose-phosphate 3-epimerase [Ruminococcus flavefaciens]|nr:ribulose-phosphate 3-epimerase [Ruminococcus flavefaciens]
MRNNLVSASILSADMLNLEREVKKLKESGIDMLHFDVMDGVFVPNITFGLPVLEQINRISGRYMELDVHLMISDPLRYIKAFDKAGADIITFHLESDSDTAETLEAIYATECYAGIAIKPNTPAEEVFPYIDERLTMVLVMTVEPGFGGQAFMDMSEKIRKIREYADSIGCYDLGIQVDGGINDKTAEIVKKAGANILVSGSYLFKSEDMKKSADMLRAEIC